MFTQERLIVEPTRDPGHRSGVHRITFSRPCAQPSPSTSVPVPMTLPLDDETALEDLRRLHHTIVESLPSEKAWYAFPFRSTYHADGVPALLTLSTPSLHGLPKLTLLEIPTPAA